MRCWFEEQVLMVKRLILSTVFIYLLETMPTKGTVGVAVPTTKD